MPLTANNQFVDDVSCIGGYERTYILRWVSLRAQKESCHPFNDCTKSKSPVTMSYLARCKFITSILSGQHYSCARSCKSHLRFQIRIVKMIFFKLCGIITNRYHLSKQHIKVLLRKTWILQISNFLCSISSTLLHLS